MMYEDVRGRLEKAREHLQKARLYVDAAHCLMYQEGHTINDDDRVLRMRVVRGDIWNAIVEVGEIMGALEK